MIIVKLKGGLGNQLFQYALGRSLSTAHKVEFKIDISIFKTYKLHAYSIGPFNIQKNIASHEEVKALTDRKLGIVESLLRRSLHRPAAPASTYIAEKHFHFDPDILELKDGVYLDGYWQSEKYFINITEIIRRQFTVKTQQTGKDKEIAQHISSCDSVNLHIRRGSYLTFPHNNVHGACSMDYYFRCVEHLTGTIKHPHFFIFSDDPQWAYDNLKLSYPVTIIDHNGPEKDYEDLKMMTLCKHHIIANSTFSWWGAWLCKNPQKMIFAPQKWFIKDKPDTKDLIPEGWHKL